MNSFSINGNLVDVYQKKIYPAEITVADGKIVSIKKITDSRFTIHDYILPGFIDSHVHIESSMLIPSEFARLAVVHGTVATVSDPHEIANVCGMKGVEFMIANGKTVPFKFNFGAPSCVPATTFETAGATLDSKDVETLLKRDDIKYLSEMMNFPGVLNEDEEVMKKIAAAHHLLKPVDGHAPGLRGEKAKLYIERISLLSDSEFPPSGGGGATDHECFTAEEALDKLKYGMKIIIREGSAAKNFEALIDLLNDYPNQMMFCSDDKHPDSLVLGHINQLCARAVAKRIDLFKVLQAACINPVLHYKLDVGLLQEGDPADFIVVKDLESFKVVKTFINGEMVAENRKSLVISQKSGVINNFSCNKVEEKDIEMKIFFDGNSKTPLVIEALDGQLITNKLDTWIDIKTDEDNNFAPSGNDFDILKIVVVNRYHQSKPAVGLIKNFNISNGAIASSVAHDSHNIIAVGLLNEDICRAINMVIEGKGGISCCWFDYLSGSYEDLYIPLPIAGLMSNEDGYKIASQYAAIDKMAKEKLGSTLSSPFMTLSFMALLVIPHLKLSDKGLFDGDQFCFV